MGTERPVDGLLNMQAVFRKNPFKAPAMWKIYWANRVESMDRAWGTGRFKSYELTARRIRIRKII